MIACGFPTSQARTFVRDSEISGMPAKHRNQDQLHFECRTQEMNNVCGNIKMLYGLPIEVHTMHQTYPKFIWNVWHMESLGSIKSQIHLSQSMNWTESVWRARKLIGNLYRYGNITSILVSDVSKSPRPSLCPLLTAQLCRGVYIGILSQIYKVLNYFGPFGSIPINSNKCPWPPACPAALTPSIPICCLTVLLQNNLYLREKFTIVFQLFLPFPLLMVFFPLRL